LAPLTNKYSITIQFTVEAESADDAEEELKNVIQEGIVTVVDNEDKEPILEYDVTDIEPAEVGF